MMIYEYSYKEVDGMTVPAIGVKEKEEDDYVYLDIHQVKTINRMFNLWDEWKKARMPDLKIG